MRQDTTSPCGCGTSDGRPRPSDVGNRGDTGQLTGAVILRLSRHQPVGRSNDLRELADELQLVPLGQLLDELDRPATRRLITSVEPGKLLELEAAAAAGPWAPLNSLARYWRVDLGAQQEAVEKLAARFSRIPDVEIAYAEQSITDPTVTPGDDPLNAQQGYLDAAPTGIDARWAWAQANGEGQGVGVVDLEQSWRLSHEDLAGKAPALIFNANRDGAPGYVTHGTGVLGVIAADDNTVGIVGIAPSLASLRVTSHWDGTTSGHVADASIAALVTMGAGDILLLEVERGYKPTEIDPADLDAIRLATASGVIVVEAAGNGYVDLDAWTDGSGHHRLQRGHPDFLDSGAIVVGASLSAVVGGAHDRLADSCFGSRVDCYAWGEHVTTSGGDGDLTPSAGPDAIYTGTFSGTSSAAAIIAGAATVTQSMHLGATQTRLSPGQMRAVLSDPANGTPQGTGVPGAIGSMPDLRLIGEADIADVYLRDAIGDTGAVPNTGPLSVSPDIIVSALPVADPDAAFGEGSGTENDPSLGGEVAAGQPSSIYVRMRNRGASNAGSVVATVYWSPAATLVTPSMWNLIGSAPAVTVPTGGALVVTPEIPWPAAAIPGAGHYCFVGVLDDPQDPAPPLPGPTDWNGFLALIGNHNNITWRNFNVIDVAGGAAGPLPLPFLVTGAPDEARLFDLELAVQLPADTGLSLEIPPDLARNLPVPWREQLRAAGDDRLAFDVPRLASNALCGVRLHRSAAHACRFLITPGKGLDNGLHTVAVRQYFEGRLVGAITWGLRPVPTRPQRPGKG